MHSTTKYLGGHSDTVGGAVIVRDARAHEGMKFVQNSVGAVPGPFDCFLVHRGMRTLHLRMAAHTENARAVVEWLREAPGVSDVRWPGFAGMVCFRHADATRIASRTTVFSLAESLGGVESLVEVPAGDDPPVRRGLRRGRPGRPRAALVRHRGPRRPGRSDLGRRRSACRVLASWPSQSR